MTKSVAVLLDFKEIFYGNYENLSILLLKMLGYDNIMSLVQIKNL